MNSTMLEYFVMAARMGSLSRAALELGIEQSTMTRQISRLESLVGVRLLHRSGRGVQLTDLGKEFLPQAQSALQAFEQTRQQALQLGRSGPAQIVVAAQPTIAWMLFGPLGQALKTRFPDVKLHMLEGLGLDLLNWLKEGKIDLALMYIPVQPQVAEFDMLLREPLYAVMAPDHELASREAISVRELLSQPLVLPSTHHGLKALLQTLARQENMPLNHAIECDGSIAITKRMVESGHGLTVLSPAAVMRECEAGYLAAVPIDDERLLRSIGLATARNRPMMKAKWEVHQIIRRVVEQLIAQHAWPGAMPPAK